MMTFSYKSHCRCYSIIQCCCTNIRHEWHPFWWGAVQGRWDQPNSVSERKDWLPLFICGRCHMHRYQDCYAQGLHL